MLDFLYVVGGLAVIILAANWLVNGAASLAKRFNVSNIVIGLTIVAFGTSAPELVINIISTVKGNTEIAIGNALGSNIANILLILGISAIIYPLSIQRNTKWKEIPFSLLAAVILLICANDVFLNHYSENQLSRGDGLVFIMFLIIFVVYTFGIAKIKNGEPKNDDNEIKEMKLPKSIFLIFLGLGGLFIGGQYFVDGAVSIARILGMSESVIGLTIVSIGTSLPELATSIVASTKKSSDIAVGNIIGSNIFNIFFVLGTSAIIKPLPFVETSNTDIMVVVVASLLLFFSTMTFKKAKLDRIEGIFFLVIYVSYISYLIIESYS